VQLPKKLLESLEGIEGFDKEAFERVHQSGEKVTSIRFNPLKMSVVNGEWSVGATHNYFGRQRLAEGAAQLTSLVPWSKHGYYLSQRPSFTFDPLFHAGCYYVQEASSMFLEQALKQTLDLSRSLKVLDLAAAPGGKSTHIQSIISKESLLVSNEVIRSRSNILKDNILKWGCDNVIVTNNDPKEFARLQSYFDVIVVDAPCSGSGLFRRDEDAIGEWSENNVQLCSQRQQRILADVWPALKRDGILIYSTCSYSKEEDEEIVKWMSDNFKMANCRLIADKDWNIVESPNGYRFWPDKVKGEGFFIACVKKLDGENENEVRVKKKVDLLNKKERDIVKKWLRDTDDELVKIQDNVYAVPKKLLNDVNILMNTLHVIYFGTAVGELVRDKLIPAHALALSLSVADGVDRVDLGYEQAISYLKKKELKDIDMGRGWKLVSHKNYPLGWINVLENRINNYYPKELRILKDI
jgi:16S rRNA C967 or C1407 C5-methylase (RsmB/RsmF family)/NOL1/NOP2/fmu family ribosome biogenesis protein